MDAEAQRRRSGLAERSLRSTESLGVRRLGNDPLDLFVIGIDEAFPVPSRLANVR